MVGFAPLLLLLIAVSTAFARPRTWTDSTCRYRVRAELLNADTETVPARIPAERLKTGQLKRPSKADRDYILRLLEEREQCELEAAKRPIAYAADQNGAKRELQATDGFVCILP